MKFAFLRPSRFRLAFLPAALGAALSQAPAQTAPEAEIHPKVITPFLEKHCVSCHGPETQKARLRLDTLPNDFSDLAAVDTWKEVLASITNHQMPPEDEPQPTVAETSAVADWLEKSLAHGELTRRSTRVVLRRLNRAEYNNTMRELLSMDIGFSPADQFPEDPAAGGFDNVGSALSLSPLQLELYYKAARSALDLALVDGPRPETIHWTFEPEENTMGQDRLRVKRGENNILLNPGENRIQDGFTVIHHGAWNTGIGFRDFRVPSPGVYHLKIRAAGSIPTRAEFVAGIKRILEARFKGQMAENPEGEKWHRESLERDLKHFETDRIYDFGPPRLTATVHLDGAPTTIAELDLDAKATVAQPQDVIIPVRMTTASAGFDVRYAYDVPAVLENFWMQEKEDFARPLLMVDRLELEGPILESWPPPSHRAILGDTLPTSPAEEPAYVRAILKRFMRQAYRRPVSDAEVAEKAALFDRARASQDSFIEAVKVPLAAVLTSPHFLFLTEPGSSDESRNPLTGHELASRLSYFLWSAPPDEELRQLAENGTLLKPEILTAQTRRLLESPKSSAFVTNFAGQWLGLRKVGANPPVENLYPEYDRHLELSIIRETEAFFETILREKLDARHLIRSTFLTINERLARFYGIDGVRGDEMRKVPLPQGVPSQRGGLVTQASILSITSNGTRTSPVTRGVWVLKTMLGADPGLPVANVGEIANSIPGIDKATVRQRLEIHRETAACARCHNKIDPLGLALENYNAAGQWRAQEGHGYNGRIEENDPGIDATATMPDGEKIDGVAGLQIALLRREDAFLNAFAKQLFTYALGREPGYSDLPLLRASVDKMKTEGRTIESLILSIVTSPVFLTK